jgi:salicylate hydroxylase
MLQYMAQGACMALEDAVCLAERLGAAEGRPDAALEAYRRARVVRTARVQLGSRMMGEHVYHPDGAHALVRNAVLSSRTAAQHYESLAWLYGGANS